MAKEMLEGQCFSVRSSLSRSGKRRERVTPTPPTLSQEFPEAPPDSIMIRLGQPSANSLSFPDVSPRLSSPLSKSIGDDLFELRHVGKLNSRVLYFFVEGRRIIAVHGIRSKTTKIAARDRKVALDRKRDWLTRNP